MALKTLDSGGSGSASDSILATDYAILMGADVINASLGRSTGGLYQPQYDSIARAQAQGIVFVTIAGNNGEDIDAIPFYPASYDLDNIIAVAASDRNDERAIFSSTSSSNYGIQSVDLAAPGTDIYTTTRGQNYWWFSGTSAAAPHVAGVVALLFAQDPSLTVTQVKQSILDSVDHLPAFSTITVSGGRLNAAAALRQVAGPQLSGGVRYYSNSQPVGQAVVELQGASLSSVASDAAGAFTFANLQVGDWRLEPRKIGDLNNGISSLDASYVLQSMVGLRTLDANQRLACDVSGNGTLSALDAALILQFKVGLILQLPVTQTCGSDWVFVPTPSAALNQQLVNPVISTGSCQHGAISYQPFTGGTVSGQDFSAILFGDCTGNWQPQ
jgi:hypothetical protein